MLNDIILNFIDSILNILKKYQVTFLSKIKFKYLIS